MLTIEEFIKTLGQSAETLSSNDLQRLYEDAGQVARLIADVIHAESVPPSSYAQEIIDASRGTATVERAIANHTKSRR